MSITEVPRIAYPLHKRENRIISAASRNRRLRRTLSCARSFSRPLRDRVRVGARTVRIGEEKRGGAPFQRAPAKAGAQAGTRPLLGYGRSAGKHMATKAIDTPRKSKAGPRTKQRRIRKIFGNIHEISEMPNLIEVQRESYEQFL